jgi:hypothetical protein
MSLTKASYNFTGQRDLGFNPAEEIEYQAWRTACEFTTLVAMVGYDEAKKMFNRNLEELAAAAKRKAA